MLLSIMKHSFLRRTGTRAEQNFTRGCFDGSPVFFFIHTCGVKLLRFPELAYPILYT